MSNLSELLPSGGGQNVVRFTASGTVASGKPVILNTDGTVTEVGTSAVSPVAPIGSTTLVDGNNTEYLSVAADPHNENRWVACYADDIGNKDLFMKVFTRSGTTITQSSAISLITGGSSNRDVCVCFDKAQANVVLLMYNNNSNDGAVRVATISGSAGSESVSLGSETAFYTSYPIFTANQKGCINLVNLDTSGTFLGIWVDANSADGTIKGRVFQVSGTSVTAGGSTTNLVTDCGSYSQATRAIREHYSDTTKAYLAYRDNASRLKMGTLTVSGTSISVSTIYTNGNDIDENGVSINPISNTKIIVAHSQNSQRYPAYQVVTDSSGSLSYGTFTVLTSNASSNTIALNNKNNAPLVWPFYYSGDRGSGLRPFVQILTSNSDASSISFSTEDEIDTSNTFSASFQGVALQEDETGHYLFLGEVSSDLYFILGKAGGNATNLTSTNFIGLASAAISDTASGDINVKGGINEAQTGLTIGSDYYVQSDGAVSTTSTSPAVKIGQAITATTINMMDLT